MLRPEKEVPWTVEMAGLQVSAICLQPILSYVNQPKTLIDIEGYHSITAIIHENTMCR
jgi:hypothetical protein